MKKSLAITAILLALVLLLSACAAEQPATETAQTEEETETEAFEGMTDADYAYLEAYLADYAEKKFVGEKLFD